MIASMTTPMYQETNVNCQNWTVENILQLVDILRENKGLKLTLSFDNVESQTPKKQKTGIGIYLSRLGIGRHLSGYTYIKTGILHCMENPEELESVTKILYPAIAKEHKTTAGRVEHGIRHAIRLAWENRNQQEWEKVFGYRAGENQDRPTNTEFLAALADYIQLEVE